MDQDPSPVVVGWFRVDELRAEIEARSAPMAKENREDLRVCATVAVAVVVLPLLAALLSSDVGTQLLWLYAAFVAGVLALLALSVLWGSSDREDAKADFARGLVQELAPLLDPEQPLWIRLDLADHVHSSKLVRREGKRRWYTDRWLVLKLTCADGSRARMALTSHVRHRKGMVLGHEQRLRVSLLPCKALEGLSIVRPEPTVRVGRRVLHAELAQTQLPLHSGQVVSLVQALCTRSAPG